jgi:hypothetical protein
LFSATLAALVVVSMPDLQPNFQDYLLEITVYYLSALPNSLALAITHPSDPPDPHIDFGDTGFIPSYRSILVNSFWLLSLLISLTCALVAILLQQWAHRHGKITSLSYGLLEQARMRVFFAAGIERLNFAFVQEALRILIQCSLVLFFAGFLLFVLALGNTIFAIACAWIGLCLVAYAYITFLPIFRPGSPFSTPLTDAWARAYAVASYAILHVLWSATRFTRVSKATREHFRRMKKYYRDLFVLGMVKIVEEETRQRTLEIDGDVLKRTLDGLRGDQDLGQFFESIIGFCDSEMVKDAQQSLDILGRKRLGQTLEGFWNRTLSSDLVTVPEAERKRRIVTCLKVIIAARLSPDDLGGVFRSIQLGHSLRHSADDDSDLVPLARCMISGILSNAERDDRWFSLAKDELGVSEDVLRTYLAHGDSVRLANLIHFIRRILLPLLVRGAPHLTREPLRILPSVSELDILTPSPSCSANSVPRGTNSSDTHGTAMMRVAALSVKSSSKFATFMSPCTPPMMLLPRIRPRPPQGLMRFCAGLPRILCARWQTITLMPFPTSVARPATQRTWPVTLPLLSPLPVRCQILTAFWSPLHLLSLPSHLIRRIIHQGIPSHDPVIPPMYHNPLTHALHRHHVILHHPKLNSFLRPQPI